jgi:hypothetical protein
VYHIKTPELWFAFAPNEKKKKEPRAFCPYCRAYNLSPSPELLFLLMLI